MKHTAVYVQAKSFRKAMLNISPEQYEYCLFSSFPKNCCEYTSYLLAKYFIEELSINDVIMVHGKNRSKFEQRHVWLKVLGYDVDITANQFSSTNKTVFCIEDSVWHRKFHIYDSYQPNIEMNHFDEEYHEQLLNDYKRILQYLYR